MFLLARCVKKFSVNFADFTMRIWAMCTHSVKKGIERISLKDCLLHCEHYLKSDSVSNYVYIIY